MNAEIIAVGSELLTPSRVDTNSLFITERLNELGIEVATKVVVGDDRARLAGLFAQSLDRADLVILTGGLGPTDDDVTRDTVAGVLGLPLDERADLVESMRRRFAARGWRMPEINRRQAMVPRGATVLLNANGTAPGLWIERGGKVVVLLPGPPREMKPIVEAIVRDRLRAVAGGARLYRRVLRITGRSESHVEEVSHPIYSRWTGASPPISTTILAAPGQVELHLTVRASDEEASRAALDGATGELAAALSIDLFSADGRTLEQVVGDLLRERRLRLAVAESCTGGLVTSRLTDVPGSSDYVERGLVTYSNRAKVELLGVPESLIAEHGAVSEPVAEAMAIGVRERSGADIGVAVTGIAGPGGATPRKPVGMVALAISRSGHSHTRAVQFPGGRELVKFQASQAALDMVRRLLIKS